MMRLGQMEKELEYLRQRVQTVVPSVSSGNHDNHDNHEMADPLQAKEKEIQRKDETITSLRLRVSTLTAQLAKTEGSLKEAATGNFIRHRQHRRKWWQFWRRSFGSKA